MKDGRIAGWHFPDKYEAVEATEIRFQWNPSGPIFGRRRHAFPVLLAVTPPKEAPKVLSELTYIEKEHVFCMTWLEDGISRELSIPIPR